jgi:hypothetical protein
LVSKQLRVIAESGEHELVFFIDDYAGPGQYAVPQSGLIFRVAGQEFELTEAAKAEVVVTFDERKRIEGRFTLPSLQNSAVPSGRYVVREGRFRVFKPLR